MSQPAVGDQAPILRRTIELPDMVAYAGATWDWHRLHYDQEFLDQVGIDRPVVDGQVFGAYMAQQVQDWLGAAWEIKRMKFRFKSMVFAGETFDLRGSVVEAGKEIVVQQEVTVDGRTCVVGETVVGPQQ